MHGPGSPHGAAAARVLQFALWCSVRRTLYQLSEPFAALQYLPVFPVQRPPDESRHPVPGAATAAPIAWPQRVGGLTTLPALMRQLGADPAAVLASAGLEPDALDDADGRIRYDAMGRLFAQAAERTGCAHFGLLAGGMWQLTDMGLVGELTRH